MVLEYQEIIFWDVFSVVCNENGFDIGENIIVNDMNNENFYNYGYYGYSEYPTATPTPALTPTIEYNETGNGIPGINVLKGVFGVDYNKYVFDNEICNEINNGMIFFFFSNFFSLFSFQFVKLDHLKLLSHDHSLFVFLFVFVSFF